MSRRNASIRVRQSFLIIATMRREESSPKDKGTSMEVRTWTGVRAVWALVRKKSEWGPQGKKKPTANASLVLSRHDTSVLESCTRPLANSRHEPEPPTTTPNLPAHENELDLKPPTEVHLPPTAPLPIHSVPGYGPLIRSSLKRPQWCRR